MKTFAASFDDHNSNSNAGGGERSRKANEHEIGKTKGRVKGNWNLRKKLGLPHVMLFCFSFFLAGFFSSTLISQQLQDLPEVRPKPRSLKSAAVREEKYQLLMPGESGDSFITSVPFQVMSWRPRILYFPNFATVEQCKRMINMARPSLKPSKLALRQGETEDTTKDVRTSSGMFISASEDDSGVLAAIEEKIARASMIPRKHGENFNILRYEIGQKYNPHYDSFSPIEYGPRKSQRVATFLIYLSDVEEGGETMFPFENGQVDQSYDYGKCNGMKVKPHRGDGLLFYSLLLNGSIDEGSLHGSCSVVRGEKWVATKWIRNEIQSYPSRNI